jgi:hypothetical protein
VIEQLRREKNLNRLKVSTAAAELCKWVLKIRFYEFMFWFQIRSRERKGGLFVERFSEWQDESVSSEE